MTRIKALLVGLLCAILVTIVMQIGLVLTSLRAQGVSVGFFGGSAGIGAVSAPVNELDVLLLSILGFVAGYWWVIRRARRVRPIDTRR